MNEYQLNVSMSIMTARTLHFVTSYTQRYYCEATLHIYMIYLRLKSNDVSRSQPLIRCRSWSSSSAGMIRLYSS